MSDFAERFEDLRIWQEALGLVNAIYEAMGECLDYAFKDQITRATVSTMNNIAEGFERRSSRDFGHFLDIAKGSAGEVRSMLYLAEDLKLIGSALSKNLREKARVLSAGIAAFRRKL